MSICAQRTIIITGAGGGLGRSHALELARRGARIVVNDLGGSVSGDGSDKGAAQKVVEEIEALGGEAVANTDSVSTPEGGASVVQTAVDAFGTVDIVINNAAIYPSKPFADTSIEEHQAVQRVNVDAGIVAVQAALPGMRLDIEHVERPRLRVVE